MPALTLTRIRRFAVDLLYPRACALCGRRGEFVCEDCWAALPRAAGERCNRCWLPLEGGACRGCALHPIVLDAVRSLFRYEGDVRRLVHKLKFGDFSALAEVMAPAMTDLVEWPVDVVAPVPLAAGRERERGYNQSRLLARGIAAAIGAALVEPLRRRGGRAPQARTASAEERRRNVRDAFALAPRVSVSGQRLLLVDDVATTGATLDACARLLRAAGAVEVTAVTFARED
jgi:ComF family protein